MDKKSKIFIAGHRGMVGTAITRNLKDNNYTNATFELWFKFIENLKLQ